MEEQSFYFTWFDVLSTWRIRSDFFHNQTRNNDLRRIITRYGVNTLDCTGDHILSYIHNDYITSDDIEIIFEFKPDVCVCEDGMLFWPDMKRIYDIHVVEKLLQNDDKGMYVRYKQKNSNTQPPTSETKLEEYNRYIFQCLSTLASRYVEIGKGHKVDCVMISMSWELLSSHRNRHFTMFEHLKHLLNKTDIIKK